VKSLVLLQIVIIWYLKFLLLVTCSYYFSGVITAVISAMSADRQRMLVSRAEVLDDTFTENNFDMQKLWAYLTIQELQQKKEQFDGEHPVSVSPLLDYSFLKQVSQICEAVAKLFHETAKRRKYKVFVDIGNCFLHRKEKFLLVKCSSQHHLSFKACQFACKNLLCYC